MTTREWRVLDIAPFYSVSDDGLIWSAPRMGARGGFIAQRLGPNGYYRAVLSYQGERIDREIHFYVSRAFLGPRPPGMFVRHLDGNPLNNTASNLAYGTPLQNNLDTVAHGGHFEARKTHCKNGHPFDESNTTITVRKNGRSRRNCRTCARASWLRLKARRAAGVQQVAS